MGSLNENAAEGPSGLDFPSSEEYKYAHKANISHFGGPKNE
jgi:hypothetical protein